MHPKEKRCVSIDPRTGLLLLTLANVIAFTQDSAWVEIGWIIVLGRLLMLCGCVCSGVKWLISFLVLLALQWYVLPYAPKFIATSFSLFINYSRRSLPGLMLGSLMLQTISLRRFIVALRKLHIPQKLIVPIAVTLRYFPAIREESGYIRDAMRLRNIRGLKKVEVLVVPLLISATGTAEELSAAAVTRGIENPVPKTSTVKLEMSRADYLAIAAAVSFTAASFLVR